MSTIRQAFGIGSMVPRSSKMIGGVELEIEDVRNISEMPYGWNNTEDGSLRNNGREFISPPLEVASLVAGFKHIHTKITHSPKPSPFSERTSIHVHVNCLDIEVSIVKQMMLWYALYEPVFFAMVAPHRKNNIHCVPLDQTTLPSQYKKTMGYLVDGWSKYTAFNMLPLKAQGTIEFRHMEGHKDDVKFQEWLKTIENWWTFSQATPLIREGLADPAFLYHGFDAIFKDSPVKDLRSSLPALTEHSLIDVKLAHI